MIVTADTNLFLYSIDERDPAKQQSALAVIRELRDKPSPIAMQVCGEFYRGATRRLKKTPWEAAQGARNLLESFPAFAATRQSTEVALGAAAAGQFSFWDANLLAAASVAGCDIVLSEDMQDGARFGRIEVVNPFTGAGLSQRARQALGL